MLKAIGKNSLIAQNISLIVCNNGFAMFPGPNRFETWLKVRLCSMRKIQIQSAHGLERIIYNI